MNNTQDDEIEIDLLHLAQVLWQHAVIIVIVGILFGAAAFGGTKLFVTPLYSSQVSLYVNSSNLSLGGTKLSISAQELSAAKSLVDTYIVILNTRTTLEEVIDRAGVDRTYSELKKMISAKSVNDTEIFSVDVTSPYPEEAKLIANTIAAVLPDKIASVVDGSSVRIVDYAVKATHRTSPNYTKNAVLGVLVGMVLMAAFYIVLDLMDEQIHDSDYLTKNYSYPVLATIPDLLSQEHGSYYYYRKHDKKDAVEE